MIEAGYTHGKFGTLMFNLCAKVTPFLVKHRAVYYISACTWGSFMTVIGLIVSAILFIVKKFNSKVTFEKFKGIYFFRVGPDYWGGCELGLAFVRDIKSSDKVSKHELGHTFQNCLLGPFYMFLVAIPSAIRWWAFKLVGNNDTPYDSVWFEDSATKCGIYAFENLK